MNDGDGTGIGGLEGPTVSVVEPAAQEKRRRGPNETVILTLFFLVCLASVGLLLWHEESRLLDDPDAKAQRGEIVGAEGDSLVRAANFERALRKIDERLGESEEPGVRVRAIDPAAPGRIFRAVQRRAGAAPENLDYFVYSVPGFTAPKWLLYLDGVPTTRKQWEADARGRDVRRLGTPSDAEAAQQACLRRARTPEDAARCQQ